MQKCNLCLERLEQGKRPVCVATCPGEALDFGSMEDLEAKPLKPSERLTADVGPSFLIAGKLPGSAFLELLRSGRFKEGPAP
jgi:Fe-S-cluster-containing dehydrogenase component